MNKLYFLIIPLLVLTLSFSCVEKKFSKTEVAENQLIETSLSDTLTFKSGIRAILQDSNGNYWIGSHNEGVSFYNGKNFQYFTEKEGLPDNQVRTIQEDQKGNIWFGTANGVSIFNGENIINFAADIYGPSIILNASKENLWFNAGQNHGAYWYNGETLNYFSFPIPNYQDSNASYAVTGISKGTNGIVWVATYSALFKIYGKSVSIFDEKKLNLEDNIQLHIRSVLSDSKGRIWIGNNGIGVLLFQGYSTINFSEKHGLIHPESNLNGNRSPLGTLEHVFAIEEDTQGNIWFGDRDTGAWKYDGKFFKNYIIDENLSSQMIWDIYKDNDDTLLFGMASGGVYSFNGNSFDKVF